MKGREEQKEAKLRKENIGGGEGTKEREGHLEGQISQRCRQKNLLASGQVEGYARVIGVTGLLSKGFWQPASNCWYIIMASPNQLEAAFLSLPDFNSL